MTLARLASVVVVALGGCVGVSDVFQCEDGSQCVQGGTPGRCEANGFCSFPDPSCASGSRYALHAGRDVAAMCTGEEGEPDGGGVVGADGPDADPAAHCGGTSLLADDFEDGVRSPTLWGQSFDNGEPLLMIETAGYVVLSYAEGRPDGQYAEYRSTRTYDLRDDHVRLQVLTKPDGATRAQAYLSVLVDEAHRIDVVAEEGNLLFLVQDPGRTVVDSVAIVTADQWWQIRESGGTIYFGTSLDGASFIDRATVAAPFDVSAVTVLFGGGTYRAESDPGSATFDNLNGGVASGTECP